MLFENCNFLKPESSRFENAIPTQRRYHLYIDTELFLRSEKQRGNIEITNCMLSDNLGNSCLYNNVF